MSTRDARPPAGAAPGDGRSWLLVGGLFDGQADRDWAWEGFRAGGKLHLYCYLRDDVIALAPFELDA